MLILTARINERFMIEDGSVNEDGFLNNLIIVQALGYHRGQIKLGFKADRDVRIDREIIYRKRRLEWLAQDQQ